MSRVDVIRVRELLGHMAEAQRQLEILGRQDLAGFLADFRNTESAKYLLIVGTESAIDVCNHLVSRVGSRAPADYADCFAALARLEVIDAGLADRMRRMARFRNLLVHVYARVDNAQVFRIINEDLADLDEFRRQILDWLGLT